MEQVGDPVLATEARSAVRKLSMDLDVRVPEGGVDEHTPERVRPEAGVIDAVARAVAAHKHLTFDYRSMDRDSTDRRAVEPYGLFYVSSHWYLAGHDRGRNDVRKFRLSRMANLRVNATRPGTPDFEVPSTFDLRGYARSRQAWELGDGDGVEVIVRFDGHTGLVDEARKLGAPVAGQPGVRRFRVIRQQVFARWLLTFAGDAVPLAPPEFVALYRDLVRQTLEVYA